MKNSQKNIFLAVFVVITMYFGEDIMRLYEIEEQEQHNKDMAKCKELLETSGFENNVELTLDHYRKKDIIITRGMDQLFFGIRGPRKRTSKDGNNTYNVFIDTINPEMPPRQHSITAATDKKYFDTASFYGASHVIIPKDNTILCNSYVYDVLTECPQAVGISQYANYGIRRTVDNFEEASSGFRKVISKDITSIRIFFSFRNIFRLDNPDDEDELFEKILTSCKLSNLGWKLGDLHTICQSKPNMEVWFDAEAIHIPMTIFKSYMEKII